MLKEIHTTLFPAIIPAMNDRPTLLLADDDPTITNSLVPFFERAGIHVGQRIDLQFLDPGSLGLEDFASHLLLGKDWSVDSQTSQLISGLEGINIQYRFGGLNRFGTISLVEHNHRIFVFNFSAGVFCDIPENQVQVLESTVYAHLLESFLFDK